MGMVGQVVAATALAAAALAGCGQTLQPRTGAPLDTASWSQGALVDASRAYPIAFWADACAAPRVIEVAGDSLEAGQWAAHLARQLNETIAAAGLYDARFSSFAGKVIGSKLEAGYHVYPCLADASKAVAREAVRAVQLRVVRAELVRIVADRGVHVVVEVRFGPRSLTYESQASGTRWDVEVFSALGAKILADPSFWAMVAAPAG